jgi:hypothetical protein
MSRAVEAGGWSVASFALWLTTLSSVTVPEVVCAAAVAVACGILAPLMRRALDIQDLVTARRQLKEGLGNGRPARR